MLRVNLWVPGGLVNGSVGIIKSIVYAEGMAPPQLPLYVLVEFDNFNGPYVINKSFPVVPIQRSWSDRGINYSRLQLPLTVAHAITIHKAQGMTLPRVVIEIGKQEYSAGLTYVAFCTLKIVFH